MWLFFGISAIISTGFNLICSFKSKNEKWFRFAALSFTALTVCSFYSDGAMRVLNEDWGGLMDIMPTMSKALWVCVGISILLAKDFIGGCTAKKGFQRFRCIVFLLLKRFHYRVVL